MDEMYGLGEGELMKKTMQSRRSQREKDRGIKNAEFGIEAGRRQHSWSPSLRKTLQEAEPRRRKEHFMWTNSGYHGNLVNKKKTR